MHYRAKYAHFCRVQFAYFSGSVLYIKSLGNKTLFEIFNLTVVSCYKFGLKTANSAFKSKNITQTNFYKNPTPYNFLIIIIIKYLKFVFCCL